MAEPMDSAGGSELIPETLDALTFRGCSAPVLFDGCQPLRSALRACLAGWPADPVDAGGAAPLAVAAPAGDGTYYVASRYEDRSTGPMPLASAACSLIADLSLDWCDTQDGVLGLHAGAVQVDGCLVVVIGPARAGKSTFTAQLATRAGARFFCDDVLPVDQDGMALGLGIAPRLRLPLPPGSGDLDRLLAAHSLTRDDRYAYLSPSDQAPFGSRAKVDAIVLLERRESGAPQFCALEPGRATSLLLNQSLTAFADGDAALSRISQLVRTVPLAQLSYAGVAEGAELLCQSLPLRQAWDQLPQAQAAGTLAPLDMALTIAADQVIARNPSARLHRAGTGAWLTRAGDPTLWQLNDTSLAIWSMLEEPGSAQELAEVLAGIVQDRRAAELEQDVAAVLAGMVAAGLADCA